jgi:ribosomal protein S12 methylthiotransferase
LSKNRELVGRDIEVLVEGSTPGCATRLRGRTPSQAPEIDGMVILKGGAQPGDFVSARVERALSYDLHAVVTDAIVN